MPPEACHHEFEPKLMIDPVYLARMALFLGSDDSAMCTANNYMVEAGSI